MAESRKVLVLVGVASHRIRSSAHVHEAYDALAKVSKNLRTGTTITSGGLRNRPRQIKDMLIQERGSLVEHVVRCSLSLA